MTIPLSQHKQRPINSKILLLIMLLAYCSLVHAQREFRVYNSYEYEADVHLPSDYQEPGEFVSGRLMYPSGGRMRWGNWEQGGTSWSVDYPKGDRPFVSLLNSFSTIDARSVEHPVNLNDGEDV